MFERLQEINQKPDPFKYYTRLALWNDKHLSKGLLKAHLDPTSDAASRNKEFMDQSIDWIITHFKIDSHKKVIDFGCGPGLYTVPFAEAGASVKGVDFSERSIRYAKNKASEKKLPIAYFLQNYLEFSIKDRFDLITLIWCDFSSLNPEQRKTILGTFYDILTDEGSILLDVHSLAHYHKQIEKSTTYQFFPKAGFFSPAAHHLFVGEFKYEQRHLLLRKETIIDETREMELYHWTQCDSLHSLSDEFKDNGLQIVEYYSDVAGKPYSSESPVIAVVAQKA